MLSFFLFFHIIVIIFCGLLTTKSDILIGKIKNKDLFFCGVVGSLSYIFLSLIGGGNEIFGWEIVSYFKIFSLNLFLSIVVAYLIWDFGLWTAGDAKLFMVFSYLIPLVFYAKGFIDFFPGMALLINIFIPPFIFVLFLSVYGLINWFWGRDKDYKFYLSFIKNRLSGMMYTQEIRRYLINLIFIFSLVQILTVVLSYVAPFDLSLNFLIFVILFFANKATLKIFKNRNISLIVAIFSIIVIIGGIIFNKFSLDTIFISLVNTLIFVVLFVLVDKLIDFYTEIFDVNRVRPQNVAPKMVLSERSLVEIKKNIGDKLSFLRAEGVDNEQAIIVRDWAVKEKKNIWVYKTMPFAPWIFGGVVLTLSFKQSILHLILNYLK